MASLRELQKSLGLKIEEVKQRDSLIDSLEREIRQRDRQITAMQAELDKFKQILKPMTQQLAQNMSIQAMVLDDNYRPSPPGRDGHGPLGLSSLGSGLHKAKDKIEGVANRMKRIAISAEPTKKGLVNAKDMIITRIEKGDV